MDSTRRGLDLLFVLSWLLAALATADLAFGRYGAASLVRIVLLVLAGGLWLLVRRAGDGTLRRSVLVLLFFAAALGLDFVGNVGMLSMLVFAQVVVVLQLGRRGGVVAIVSLVGLVALFVVGSNTPLEQVLSEVLVIGTWLLFAVVVAQMMRSLDAERRRSAELASQAQALTAELRRTLESEKELVLAQERARSARDLHDGLGHRLTLVGMSLDYALRARESSPERAWDEVTTAREAAGAAMATMRTWVRALHPVDPRDGTGVAALEAVAESFRGTGLSVNVEVSAHVGSGGRPQTPGGVPVEAADALAGLPRDTSLFVYRFVQESLTNALRHADAAHVDLAVAVHPNRLVLEAVNDGVREESATTEVTEGFGLRSLRERAEALGGTCRAEQRAGTFRLHAEVAA